MTAPAPTIAAQKGRAFLLKISNGVSPPTFNTISGMRANGVSINNNPVDITTKTSVGFRELMPDGGIQQFSFTGSGVWDSSNQYLLQLQQNAVSRVNAEYEIVSGAGDAFVGLFAVSAFSRDGTHNDAETFSVTLESASAVTYLSKAL